MNHFRAACHLIRFGSEPRENPEKFLREGTALPRRPVGAAQVNRESLRSCGY